MQLQPLSDMLAEMLAEAPAEGDEAVLARSDPLGSPANPAIVLEYDRRYEEAVEALRADLGPPHPAPTDDASAEWPSGDRVACWEQGEGLVYVAQVRREGAISILAGARPHGVKQHTITLRPPGD